MAKTDLDKVLEYVNNSADKARNLMFEETSNTASHVTTIITCEQIAKFIKKLQEKNKEKEINNYSYGNNI
jgi:uncharacterized protein YoxC